MRLFTLLEFRLEELTVIEPLCIEYITIHIIVKDTNLLVILRVEDKLEKSEYAVTPFKLNEMPKINEISHFAHIDYQAFAINDCAACF